MHPPISEKSRAERPRDKAAFVSVIVPCRNERAWLPQCLDSILASDYPSGRMEVLVADGRSEDGTREIVADYAARHPRVRLIDNPERITPVALNRAIRAACGEIIVCMGAHAEIPPQYLRRAVAYLDSTGADNVGGTMRTVARDAGVFAEPIRVALTHRFGVGNSRFRTGCSEPQWVDTVFGGCWRRELFTRIGLFNEKLVRSQDMEFNIRLRRAGGRILLAPDMETRYYARAAFFPFCAHNWINGVWAVLPFAYSRVVPVRWRHLIPLLFVTCLVAAIGAAVARWVPWWPAIIVAGAYGAANLIASTGAAVRGRSLRLAALLPVTFAALHIAYGAGSLWGVFKLGAALCRKLSRAPLKPDHDSTGNSPGPSFEEVSR